MDIRLCDLQTHGDYRGKLNVIEGEKDIPFEIKRVYFLYDTVNGFVRGMHAHKKLQQILVCVGGSCKLRLNDGNKEQEVVLDNPNKGLYIGPGIWREMYDFSDGAVLLVLASELYDESDYIRDYHDFLNVSNAKDRADDGNSDIKI